MPGSQTLPLDDLRSLLESRVRWFHGSLPPPGVIRTEEFGRDISRRISGTQLGIRLNPTEAEAYFRCLDRMRRTANTIGEGQADILSERAADKLLGTAVIEATFDPETGEAYTSNEFDHHLGAALDSLMERLRRGPVEWEVAIPIANCKLQGPRYRLGKLNFTRVGSTFLSNWRQKANAMINATLDPEKNKRRFRDQLTRDLETHWKDNVVATQSTMAYDEEAALASCRDQATREIEIINFLADFVFPHSPAMYLTGAAGSGIEFSIAHSDERMNSSWNRPGLLPVELHRLRKEARRSHLSLFGRLLRDEQLSWRDQTVLAAARHCGQARLTSDPATRFLHYAIALDALLPAPRSSARGLSQFIAHVMGGSKQSRQKTAKMVHELYSVRNEVVHGESASVSPRQLDRIRRISIAATLRIGIEHRSIALPESKGDMQAWLNQRLLR